MNGWREEDQALLERMEDEGLAEELFRLIVGERGDPAARIHPRAGGLVGEVRKVAGGSEAVKNALAGDVAGLGRFIDSVPLRSCPPELLHHLAIFHARSADALESRVPDLAAHAWVWALASWLALAEERAYLSKLEAGVLGNAAKTAGIPPERVPLELIADLGRRADAAAPTLSSSGTAALRALAKCAEAAKIAGISEASARVVKVEANRRRNAAIEVALNHIADGLDEANVRGEIASAGRLLIQRAVAVWTWSGHDEAVEHFVIGQLDRIGWELYRARNWSELRYLMDPFRPMLETLADRVEKDPSQLAYAAGCAQMFVFMAETDINPGNKLALAERAMMICPTHRNGRVVLASILCDRASALLRTNQMVVRRDDVENASQMIERAEKLYPQTRELAEVKKKLASAKANRLIW